QLASERSSQRRGTETIENKVVRYHASAEAGRRHPKQQLMLSYQKRRGNNRHILMEEGNEIEPGSLRRARPGHRLQSVKNADQGESLTAGPLLQADQLGQPANSDTPSHDGHQDA